MVAEAFLMRGVMAMALLLLLGLCSVSLSAASALPSDGLNQKSLDFNSGRLRHRSLLQVPPTPVPSTVPPPASVPSTVTPPTPAPGATPPRTPPTSAPIAPVAPVPAPIRAPSPAPRATPAPPTPTRVYLMWVGIGAFILVLASVAVFCLCRKFGENKIRRGQRMPPLPRYH